MPNRAQQRKEELHADFRPLLQTVAGHPNLLRFVLTEAESANHLSTVLQLDLRELVVEIDGALDPLTVALATHHSNYKRARLCSEILEQCSSAGRRALGTLSQWGLTSSKRTLNECDEMFEAITEALDEVGVAIDELGDSTTTVIALVKEAREKKLLKH